MTATCKSGTMNIKVVFTSPYSGAVHARDYRNPNCMTFGNGTTTVGMSLNLLAKREQSDYCGILISNVSGDVRFFKLFTKFINFLILFIYIPLCNIGVDVTVNLNIFA